jgi:hypothetical protein
MVFWGFLVIFYPFLTWILSHCILICTFLIALSQFLRHRDLSFEFQFIDNFTLTFKKT